MLNRRHLLAASAPGLPRRSRAPRAGAGGQEAGPRHRRLSGRRRHRRHRARARRSAARRLCLDGPGREQARRQRPHRGGVCQERGARRQRDAVHAGLPDDALSAQLQVAELRSAEGFHPGRSGHHLDAELQRRPGRAGQRQDARRLCGVVQGQSGQGVLRHHLGRRHAAFRRRDVRQRSRRSR